MFEKEMVLSSNSFQSLHVKILIFPFICCRHFFMKKVLKKKTNTYQNG